MHDSMVVTKILDAVKGYSGLLRVYVSVGRRSCIRPDMLKRSFDAAKQGTKASEAELVTVPCPGEGIVVLSVEVEAG